MKATFHQFGIVCLGIAIWSSRLASAGEVLDIDPLTGMVNSPGSSVPIGSQVSSQFLAQSVIITSGAGFAAVAKGFGVHWFADPILQNGLGGTNSAGALSYTAPVIFMFVDPENPSKSRTITSFTLSTDHWGLGQVCSLSAFNAAGTLIASETKAEHIGVAQVGTAYSVSAPGIVRVEFLGAGTQAVSNIQFGPPQSICPADLNADGVVGGADLAIVLGQWATAGTADLSGNGTVDGADISIILGFWGPC